MHCNRTARAAAAVLALATLAGPARAQDAVDHFGGNEGTTTIGALSFIGLPYPDANGFSQFTYVFPGGGVSGTALVELPNGAEITQLCVVGYDSSPHGAVTLSLIGWEYPRVGTATPTASRILATASTGAVPIPGMTTACAPIAAPILVKSFGDVDANGVPGWTAYGLQGSLFYTPGGGAAPLIGSVSFGAAIVVWRRTVSPGPAVATFTDVPTTHPQYRFVQAFVASGLAAGCATDRFCPDAGVTRGQLAVFLSVALGLHFPN